MIYYLPKGAELVEAHSVFLFMWLTYLIQCEDSSIYTGITNNLEQRFKDHSNGKGGHYTRSHKVIKILYSEEFGTKSQALKREAQIKGWRREKKLNLIKFGHPNRTE